MKKSYLIVCVLLAVLLMTACGDNDDNNGKYEKENNKNVENHSDAESDGKNNEETPQSNSIIDDLEKSRESKDLMTLDTIYNGLNTVLANEEVYVEVTKEGGLKETLEYLLSEDSKYQTLKTALEEYWEDVPELSAKCNENGTIMVVVDSIGKGCVYVADKDGNVIIGEFTVDSNKNPQKMYVGIVFE